MFEEGFGDVSGTDEFDPTARHPDTFALRHIDLIPRQHERQNLRRLRVEPQAWTRLLFAARAVLRTSPNSVGGAHYTAHDRLARAVEEVETLRRRARRKRRASGT